MQRLLQKACITSFSINVQFEDILLDSVSLALHKNITSNVSCHSMFRKCLQFLLNIFLLTF